MHPFISAMVRFLLTGGRRAQRPGLLAPLYRAEDQKFFEDIEYMRKLSREIVQERVQHPRDTNDLLNAMVNGKDPKTGNKLSEDTIMDNVCTP